jgi:uncharacterized protein YndB with AHSA1/START domain
MITYTTRFEVAESSAKDIHRLLLSCDDDQYRRWWPGTHLAFHAIKRTPTNVGNLVYLDEYVGDFRLRFHGVVKALVPDREIVWQLRALGIFLPAWVVVTLSDTPNGVMFTHTVSAGYRDIGSILDVLLRRYLSRKFERQMAEHAQVEFNRLRDLLQEPELAVSP